MSQVQQGAPRPWFLQRLMQEHARVLFFSLGKLWANSTGTLLTALVIGVTLALPAGLHVVIKNVTAVSQSWESTLRVSLFLKDSITADRALKLRDELKAQPGVGQVDYISREQALAEFREISGFGEALDLLAENPLPAVIVLTPRSELNQQQVNDLVRGLELRPEVDQAKIDQKWLERLYALLEIAKRAVWLLAGMLALAVIVVVGNTIRLDIENRREEIVVMKLIGAPDGFIRRPFLYTGFWYGMLGGVIAMLLVLVALLAVRGPANLLSSLYGSSYTLAGLSPSAVLLLFVSGIALGWLGAFWTVSRHLSQIEPR